MKDRSEKSILNRTLVEVSSLPRTLVYRNNTGMAWQGLRVRAKTGEKVVVEPGMIILRNGRPVHFGLEGSGDIQGVSEGTGLAIETKTVVGRQRDSQKNFQTAWERAGGIYIIARSPEDATIGLLMAKLGPKLHS